MPRTIPPALKTAFESESIESAVLVLLTRTDGVELGFTDADEPITYDGNTFEPSDGLSASSIAQTASSGVDNLDVGGVLKSARITEADIVAGRYDGCRVLIRLVNRADLSDGDVVLLTGIFGEVRVRDGVFHAEVRSLSHLLKQAVGDMTSKTCRVRRLGDTQCGVNLGGSSGGTPLQSNRTLASGSGLSLTFGSDSAPSGFYDFGIVKFTSGLNDDIEREIKTHVLSTGSAVLTLRTAFPFAVAPGDTALLTVGCDRVFGTCVAKFANANNFRGEHLLPGNDVVVKMGRPPR
mgnify:CR=1 FL=1